MSTTTDLRELFDEMTKIAIAANKMCAELHAENVRLRARITELERAIT